MSRVPAPIGGRSRLFAVALLFGAAFVSYFDRVNLSVAAVVFMPVLALTKSDIAWVFNSFLVGYALFQVPAGWFGDRYGARLTLGWSTLCIGAITLFTAVLPGHIARTLLGAFLVLSGLRFLLGVAEAATFPVATQAASQWMAPERRGLANSAVLIGSSVGSAVTGPLISWVLVHFGWRASLVFSAAPAFVVGAGWFAFRQPRALDGSEVPARSPMQAQAFELSFLLTPNVLLLAVSYFAEGYLLFTFVSWLYIYLVEVRHFSLLAGGFAASLPWMTAIAATPLGGFLADSFAARIGRARASQVLIMAGYTLSGALLFAAAYAETRTYAVLALCLSLGALYLAEPSFWTVANALDPERGGVVSGFMNTLGILGGIASNALVPVLVAHGGWRAAFGSGTVMGLFTAVLWIVLAARLRRSSALEPLRVL